MVIWLIGLPGSGKSTIGEALRYNLLLRSRTVILLDGETIRSIVGDNIGHSLGDRRIVADRIWRLSKFLESNSIDVICAVSGLFEDVLERNRNTLRNYFEVYVNVPLDELELRDQNGLYSGARAGTIKNVLGIDIPFNPPQKPHLEIQNNRPFDEPKNIAQNIMNAYSKSST